MAAYRQPAPQHVDRRDPAQTDLDAARDRWEGAEEHVERIVAGEDQEEREVRLGAWIGNQRSRSATLSPERVELLSKIGMRWA